MKSFLGNFYRDLAIFSGHTACMLSPITKHKDQNDFIKSLKIAGHTFHYDMTLDYSIEIEAAQRERERERERDTVCFNLRQQNWFC